MKNSIQLNRGFGMTAIIAVVAVILLSGGYYYSQTMKEESGFGLIAPVDMSEHYISGAPKSGVMNKGALIQTQTRVYTNSKYGYKILVPNQFQPKINNDQIVIDFGTTSQKLSAQISIEAGKVNPENCNIKDSNGSSYSFFVTDNDKSPFVSESGVTFFDGAQGGGGKRSEVYTVVQNAICYQITFTTNLRSGVNSDQYYSGYSEVNEFFKPILYSFKFTN